MVLTTPIIKLFELFIAEMSIENLCKITRNIFAAF